MVRRSLLSTIIMMNLNIPCSTRNSGTELLTVNRKSLSERYGFWNGFLFFFPLVKLDTFSLWRRILGEWGGTQWWYAGAYTSDITQNKAYEVLRDAGLFLPSQRTLRDYIYYTKSATGFPSSVDEQLLLHQRCWPVKNGKIIWLSSSMRCMLGMYKFYY